MTKRDRRAIVGALYATRVKDVPAHVMLTPTDELERAGRKHQWRETVSAIAGVLAADDPHFDSARFMSACDTGNTGKL